MEGLCRISAVNDTIFNSNAYFNNTFQSTQNDTRIAVCRHEDGTPLYENGPNFKVIEMKFEWQTCVSLHGTTLDIGIKYDLSEKNKNLLTKKQNHEKKRYQDEAGNIFFLCFSLVLVATARCIDQWKTSTIQGKALLFSVV